MKMKYLTYINNHSIMRNKVTATALEVHQNYHGGHAQMHINATA